MNPRGPTPKPVVGFDEVVFEADGSAAALESGIAHLMGDFVVAYGDHEVTLREAQHMAGHMKRLHSEAGLLCSLLAKIREAANKVIVLVRSLRGRFQEDKKVGGR